MVSAIYILHYESEEGYNINNNAISNSDSYKHYDNNDKLGDVSFFQCLTSRRYRGNCMPDDISILNAFYHHLTSLEEQEHYPVLYIKNFSYIYIRCENGIILLAIANANENVMQVIMFLKSFQLILIHYLCKGKGDSKLLTREKILDNIIIISELLDECLDFGILQITDYKLLEEYIKAEPNVPKISSHKENSYESSSSSSSSSEYDSDDEEGLQKLNNSNTTMYKYGNKNKLKNKTKTNSKNKNKNKSKNSKHKKDIKSTHNQAVHKDVLSDKADIVNSSILRTYSLAINWRPKGIFYAKNEIFVDIIEDCEFVYDLATQSIKRNEIYGTCVVKSYLSGIPICRLGFNEDYMTSIRNEDKEAVIEKFSRTDSPLPENQLSDEAGSTIDETEEEILSETEANNPFVPRDGVNSPLKEYNTDEKTNPSTNRNTNPNTDTNTHVSTGADTNTISSSQGNGKKPKHVFPIRNIQFHQCIELAKIYRDNIMTFIPPDDKFILMTFNVEQQKNRKKLPLIMINPMFKVVKQDGVLQIMCTLSTNFPRRRHCRSLLVKIPINPFLFELNLNKTDLKYKTDYGEVTLKVDTMDIIWKIDTIDGKQTARMMCELALLNVDNITSMKISDFVNRRVSKIDLLNGGNSFEELNPEDEAMHELDDFYGVNGHLSTSARKHLLEKIKKDFVSDDIQMTFKIPMYTYSGLKLTYLSVEEEQMKYPCFPWIRYLTKSVDSFGQQKLPDSDRFNGQNCSYRFKLGLNSFAVT